MRRFAQLPFQAGQISEFLGGRSVSAVEFLTNGRRNSNYKIRLDDGLTCVVRLCAGPVPDGEVSAMQVAATVVPVANVLAAGDRWTVLSWLPGVPLTEAGSGGLFSAARALGRIASVQLPSAGWITRDQGIRAFSFGGIRGFLAARLASPAAGDRLGSSRLRKIHRVVVSQRSRLEQMDSQHCLVHGDFNPTNILISEGLVSGILDWEFSHSGCPWMDVGNLLRHTDAALRPEIARGLEAGGMTLSADWQPWARLADLSAHLQFLDVGDTPADLVEGSLQWLERFVEDFDPGENG